MPRAQPGQRFGGRVAGTKNKFPSDIKAIIHGALFELGGLKYLVKQGKENPVAFMNLVGKIIPREIIGDQDKPVVLSIEDKRAAGLAAVAALERAFARVAAEEEAEDQAMIDVTPEPAPVPPAASSNVSLLRKRSNGSAK